ncbi:hypothetical protein KA977_04910 [Candidatus Dependentiae bacterium]|nr:hypothetical protein [Candidatus Dependentiae bacterium]
MTDKHIRIKLCKIKALFFMIMFLFLNVSIFADNKGSIVQSLIYFENEKYSECIKEINFYKKSNYIEPWLKYRINLLLAECYINVKDYNSAENEIDGLIYSGTPDKQYELSAHFFKASILLAFDRYDELVELLAKIKKEFSSITDDWYLDYNRALIYYKKTDYTKAVEILNGLKTRINSEERKNSLNLIYGEIYFNQNKFKTALDFYNSSGYKNEDDPYLSYKKALSLFNLKYYDEAVFELNKKVRTTSEKLLFLRKYLQSLIFIQQLKFDEAIQAIGKLKDFDEFNFYPELKLAVAISYYFTQKYDSAEQEIIRFFKQYPETSLKVTAQKILIDVYIGSKKYDKSLSFIEELEKNRFPDREYLEYKKMSVLFRKNNLNEFMIFKNEYSEKYFENDNFRKVNLLSGLFWFINGNYSLCASDLGKITVAGGAGDLISGAIELSVLSNILSGKLEIALNDVKRNKNSIGDEKYYDYIAECFNKIKLEEYKNHRDFVNELRPFDLYLLTGKYFNKGKYGELVKILDDINLSGDKKNEILIYYKAVDFFMNEKYDNAAGYLNSILSKPAKFNSEYVNKSRLLLSEIYGKLNYADSAAFQLKNMADSDDGIDLSIYKKLKKIDSLINTKKYFRAEYELKSISSDNVFCLYNKFITAYKISPELCEQFLVKMINNAQSHNLTLKAVYFYSKYLNSINKKSLAVKLLLNNKPAEGYEIPHYCLLYKIYAELEDKKNAEKIFKQYLSAVDLDKSVINFIIKQDKLK